MKESNTSKNTFILSLLVALIALESMSIDLYLPAFHTLSVLLNTSLGNIQISLGLFLLGFALGQLIWGVLSDRWGRKKPLFIGILMYTAASFLLIHITSVSQLWGLRFVQAVGGAAGVVIARAIVVDLYKPEELTKIFSILIVSMGVFPIIAPGMGSWIKLVYGWQGIFYFMFIFGSFVCMWIIYIPETQGQSIKTESKQSSLNINNYKVLLKNSDFILFTLSSSLAYSILMIYVSNATYLHIEIGKLSEYQFDLIFGVNAILLMLSSAFVPIVSRFVDAYKILKLTWVITAVISTLQILIISFFLQMVVLQISWSILIFLTGIILPITTSAAMKNLPINTNGIASAVLGGIQLLITAFINITLGFLRFSKLEMLSMSCFFISVLAIVLLRKK